MKQFWIDTMERAVKTAAQTAIAAIGTSTVIGEINWVVVASTIGVATLLSILTSIASHGITGTNSASLLEKREK